ncbi:MAG TPA: haloalkane dehalogenase [Pseudonocardia sp.]|jgi:haloalkane dehalogenase
MDPVTWRKTKKYAQVLGSRMAYVEQGEGAPIVLLHGNPTSSFLWRNVVPELAGLGRCLVPDLIGMGDSDKLPASDARRYTFTGHRDHLDGLLEQLLGANEQVTLVVHDWGSGLGFDWARRHPDRVRGIAYMEAIVGPIADWDGWPGPSRRIFQGFRSPAGEQMVLTDNVFVERVLPGSILRTLTPEEMDEYRRPFATPGEDRLPTLTWPRQIPIGGEPADVTRIAEEYSHWLATAAGVPKLFVNAEPGAILTGAQRDFCRTWPDQAEVTVAGSHFVQEDSGKEIGQAVASWLMSLS